MTGITSAHSATQMSEGTWNEMNTTSKRIMSNIKEQEKSEETEKMTRARNQPINDQKSTWRYFLGPLQTDMKVMDCEMCVLPPKTSSLTIHSMSNSQSPIYSTPVQRQNFPTWSGNQSCRALQSILTLSSVDGIQWSTIPKSLKKLEILPYQHDKLRH
jgi:hypothetical protein